ncbi:MAG TPA: hypothetical protein VF219_07610 [Vicinamibacterales bacterium]
MENIYHDLRYARAMLRLYQWESFYVIVGSSAAALTGLQFVVVALGAEVDSLRDASAVAAFGTPTVVHFCGVLTIAALIAVPGQTPITLGCFFVTLGIAGVIYTMVTARRAKRQAHYEPVFEDWLWHVGLPLVSYTVLLITGASTFRYPTAALYAVAAVALALLFIGIHNAWDSAVYISTRGRE